jgi:FAD/FMN-containing dehydrogenase
VGCQDAYVDEAAVAEFAGVHRGPVIGPADVRFDGARRSFNALVEARPELIVRPVGDADVAAAIGFACARGLGVSVRGGGHSVAGHSVGHASVMIDLRLLREVTVDADAQRVLVGGGACWNDVDAAAQGAELALPGGTYGDTGVGGLTLAGGIGHLTGAYGLTLDNLVSARLVTAAGEVIWAAADREPELFWALRGGGGNFGVVTEFEFALHPVLVMTGGVVIHSLRDAPAALRAFRDMRAELPDALTLMPQLMPVADYVEEPRGLLTSVAYLGPPAEAAAALAPFRSAARPLFDNVGINYYSQLQSLFPYLPFGLRNYWTGRFVETMPDDLIDDLVEDFAQNNPDVYSAMLFEPLHGAVARVDPAATAFAFRHARFNVSPMAIWADPALDQAQVTWAQTVRDRLRPLATGGYLNYATDDSPETVEDAYGAQTFARLQAAKRTWDPGNLFRHNHNIPPAA